MSKFTAPSWDVDGAANILCDNFSGGQKLSKKKRADKKKFNVNNYTAGGGSKGTFKSKRFDSGKEVTQKKIDTHKRVKTKNNKFNPRKSFKKERKFEGNVSSGNLQNYKGGNDNLGKKQKLKNFKHAKESDFVQSSEGSMKAGFSNQKKNRKRKESQFTNGLKEVQFGSKKIDFKSSKEIVPKAEKNKNKRSNFQSQNHSGDTSFHHVNRVKNRKRNSAHLSESQNNWPSVKKKKLDSVETNHQVNAFSEKSVIKGKQFTGHKNLNEQKNKVVNNNNSGNGNREMKSPYLGKNRFFDSSLTLRERMLLQLKSSRFRYINEQLYTSNSKDAEVMFKEDPNLFKIYHEGFKQQVELWPVNPVEKIINAIQKKPANFVVADFGCGDAKLAKSVPNKVHSFDLVALSDEVTVCDMAHTPLESGCVDICVFCLSLMGTNLGSYLVEANRILKVGGTVKIAEVASRFASVEQFVKNMKKYGFSLINKDLSHDLFYFLNFQKDTNITKVKGLPDLSLNPCWYKKR